jgi:hypothetical protein
VRFVLAFLERLSVIAGEYGGVGASVSIVYEPWRIKFFIDCERDMIRRGYPKGKSQSQQEQVGETKWVETAGNVQCAVGGGEGREVGQDVSDRDPGVEGWKQARWASI